MTDAKRRHICRVINLAVESCEESNLSEQLEVPRWIADLVVQLQASTGEELLVPRDTVEAHGQLLDLRERYMPALSASERERGGAVCDSCEHPLRPLCRFTTCTECRRLKRLMKGAAAALAS